MFLVFQITASELVVVNYRIITRILVVGSQRVKLRLNVSFRSYQLQYDRVYKISLYWVESRKRKKFLTVKFDILRYVLL